jgi:hypothetical protein
VGDKSKENEEMRQCPTCRMTVSVWATKCHHCGEEVGRPRREETKLTLKDLGGSQQSTYVPSGNVTGALESFRVEENASEKSAAAPRPYGILGSLFGKRRPLAAPEKSEVEEMPELDEYSKNLAASILDDGVETAAKHEAAKPAPQTAPPAAQQIFKVGAVLIGLVVVYFFGSFVWAKTSAYLEARNQPLEVVYINKAPEMLARGELSIDVFEEAMKAVGIKDTEENQTISRDVRTLLLKDIDAMLASNPWKLANQDKAYEYIRRARIADGHSSVAAKWEEVVDTLAAYKFVLKAVDETGTQATFRLNNPKFEAEVTVGVADRLMDRFIIQRVSKRNVDLVDEKVEGRKLTIGLNEGVKSRY